MPPDRSFRNALGESSVAVLSSWPVGAPNGRDSVAVTTMVAPAGTLLKLQTCSVVLPDSMVLPPWPYEFGLPGILAGQLCVAPAAWLRS